MRSTGVARPDEVLAPERALLHPAFVLALATLALNDHVFKGGGLLPSVITGKLSDVAGLFVAPALLATVIRARRRRAVLGCHVGVGVVFAILELWPRANDAWCALFTLVGVPWRTWSDPTDLLALPAVALAYWASFRPLRDSPKRRAATRPPSRGELFVLAVGLFFCLATGTVPPPRPQIVNGSVVADVYLQVPDDGQHFVEVDFAVPPLDCGRLFADPASVLRSAPVRSAWRGMTKAGSDYPLWPFADRPPGAEGGCAAALITISQSSWFGLGDDEDLPLTYVIWDTNMLPVLAIPRRAEGEPRPVRSGALIVRELEERLALEVRGPMKIVPATLVHGHRAPLVEAHSAQGPG